MLKLKSDSIIKVFYLLGLTVLQLLVPEVTSIVTRGVTPDWFWPLWWARDYISHETVFALISVTFLLMIIQLAWGQYRWVRALGAVAWFLTMTLAFPAGSVWNSVLLWPGVALLLVWPKADDPAQIRKALYIAQAYALSVYFSSGLWKVRALYRSFDEGDLPLVLRNSLPTSIASALTEGTGHNNVVFHVLQNFPLLSSFLWIAIVFLQLSTIGALIWPKWISYWGTLLIFFHFGVVICMGPSFSPQLLLISYLFFLAPLLLNAVEEKKT